MRLIDADKLMELYENTPECNIDDCHVSIPVVRQNILDMPTINPYEWINVEDRLPTEGDGTVLVCMPDVWPYNHAEPFVNAKHDCRVRVAHYSEFSNDWTYEMGAKNSEHKPTHWMPLPTPPTEKEN